MNAQLSDVCSGKDSQSLLPSCSKFVNMMMQDGKKVLAKEIMSQVCHVKK